MKVKVIIPVFNESGSIGHVVREIPAHLVNEVIVVNNGSTDDTATIASMAGATVLTETEKGYGAACLKGMEYVRSMNDETLPDVIVFLDGDYSDYPEEIEQLLLPIQAGTHDMVIGSRALGVKERGSMTVQQIFGNWLATSMMRWFFRADYSDLGPFRAIRWEALEKLEMVDRNYGWTVEMQIKAAKKGLRYTEIPVRYRKRIGKSKVSGTVKGTVMAGYKIITTIIKYA
jgi:glycosyltransferase involved in cell wall biosynthesis